MRLFVCLIVLCLCYHYKIVPISGFSTISCNSMLRIDNEQPSNKCLN